MHRFEPSPSDTLTIGATTYKVAPHPSAKKMAFGQEGRKAVVYQLLNNSQPFALKIFKPQYRSEELVNICDRLSQLSGPGLEVCTRECLTTSSAPDLVKKYSEMEFAVLMPWAKGSTWFDIINSLTILDRNASKAIAKNLARVLSSLEKLGYAHCDIAGANVIVNTGNGEIELIDVEDIWGPGFPQPNALPMGTDGYQHRTSRSSSTGQWCVEGDRFSAAVLIAEILGWSDATVRSVAYGEHYFDPKELQDDGSKRYKLLLSSLESYSQDIADCFSRAWSSSTLAECPTLGEWAALLEFPFISSWRPIQVPPPQPYNPHWQPIRLPFSTLPEAPKFFRATREESGVFQLLWLEAKGAESYVIEACKDASFSQTIEVYQGSHTTWILDSSITHPSYFRIRSHNSNGNSDWSAYIKTW